jgi:hypothetical protein
MRAKNRTMAEKAIGSKAISLGTFMGSVRPGAIIRIVAGIEYVTYLNAGFGSLINTLKYY